MSIFHGRISIINKFCEYFKGKKLHFIIEVKSDRKAFFVTPQTKKGYLANQDELVDASVA